MVRPPLKPRLNAGYFFVKNILDFNRFNIIIHNISGDRKWLRRSLKKDYEAAGTWWMPESAVESAGYLAGAVAER